MKRLLQSYTSFNKTERAGLAGVLIILFLLIVFRIGLSHFVPVKSDDLKRQQLLAKWQGIKQNKSSNEYLSRRQPVEPQHTNTIEQIDIQSNVDSPPYQRQVLFMFDPNSLDSLGFRKLGLREKTTSILLNWRRKGKVFKDKAELRKLYTLTEEEYQRLEPYIRIEPTTRFKKVNLNTADSVDLVYLNGIGPKLAHKIIEYRKKYGPFASYDQLYEVYRFPDSVFRQLSRELTLK